LSACVLSKAATSASTACVSNARAPLRSTSVSGSAKAPGWVSQKTLVSVTAYHSFGGEVGGFEHPHDTPPTPSCRHQLSPIARKRNTKATKTTQQAPQTPAPADKSELKVPGLSEEIITPVPRATNNASTPALGTAKADFVADPEPVPEGGGFLCTFTLSRPGLVGLNKLAVHLNDLQDSGSIGGWQAKGWENAATKVRTLIGFANRADAIIAIKGAH